MKENAHSLIAILVAFAASASVGADEKEKPFVFVPVLPYEFLFEKIGGDLIDVEAIVGKDDDAHTYSPTPKQIVKMAQADLLCSGELGFEANYLIKVGNGKDAPKSVNLIEGLDLLEGHCDHPSHDREKNGSGENTPAEAGEASESEHHHDHGRLNDPHVWLSPSMLMKQAVMIAGILKELLPPEKSGEIDANFAKLKLEIENLDTELKAALLPFKGRKFYVYHGAFAYFARDYGLEQVAIEIANRSPTPKQLANIVTQAKEDGVKLIFVQPQFDQSNAKALAGSIDGTIAILDPLEKDVLANLRAIARAVSSK